MDNATLTNVERVPNVIICANPISNARYVTVVRQGPGPVYMYEMEILRSGADRWRKWCRFD